MLSGRPPIPKREINGQIHKRCCRTAHVKRCPCGHEDERTDDYRYMTLDCFSPDNHKRDGLSAKCKQCNNSSSIVSQALRMHKEIAEVEKIIKDVKSHRPNNTSPPSNPLGLNSETQDDDSSDPFGFL